MKELTAERLRELLNYDPETGHFTWRVQLGAARIGDIPACFQRYFVLQIEGRRYTQHRLAWLHVHGHWPKGTIDHINRNPRDNRLANLRDVTRSMNNHNRGPMRRAVNSLPTGVSPTPGGMFSANIRIGVYKTPAEAEAAYLKVKRILHAGFRD